MTELFKLNKEIEAAFAELEQTGEEHLFEKFEALGWSVKCLKRY